MGNGNIKESWARTLRHLAACRFYLREHLDQESEGIWKAAQDYLHHNEFELALDEVEALGEKENAPPDFWHELLLAAENMSLSAHVERYHAKL